MISNETATTALLERNIKQALKDYGAHTHQTKVLDDVSERFVEVLAEDATKAKRDLRELLRKSPAWDEELQSVVINGTRTHDPDYNRVNDLALQIFTPYLDTHAFDEKYAVLDAIKFFSNPDADDECKDYYIGAIKRIAPKAYRANRKKSRIFKNLCDVLGVTDDTAGSKFQRLFAQFADELSGKKLDFKLFLSINPAHFLTMSNPKNDDRGTMLTSCHSFNSTEYQYNNGNSGYARDKVTMIAFTVDNPNNSEFLNNRKTTRQLFMYKVGNGLLLQSRMYNSNGGVYGTSELTPLYRDLVQRELSELEGVPNLWKTYTYHKDRPDGMGIDVGFGFGGYPDWTYSDFDAKISIRVDHLDDFRNFSVGTYGLCIGCGEEISEGLYCDDCGDKVECDCCGERFCSEDLWTVYNSDGDEIQVCEACRDSYYELCDCCGDYYPSGSLHHVLGKSICSECLDEHYGECSDCGELHRLDDMRYVIDECGDEVQVCDSCFSDYSYCDGCDNYVHDDECEEVTGRDGLTRILCKDCRGEDYAQCDDCGKYYHKDLLEDGKCPECRAEDE